MLPLLERHFAVAGITDWDSIQVNRVKLVVKCFFDCPGKHPECKANSSQSIKHTLIHTLNHKSN